MTTHNRKFLRKNFPVVPTKPSITINTDIEDKRILENPGIRPLLFKKNDPPVPVLPTPENNYEPSETPMSLHGEVPIWVQTPDQQINEDRTPEIVLDNPPLIQRDNPLPIKMDNPPLPQAKSPQPLWRSTRITSKPQWYGIAQELPNETPDGWWWYRKYEKSKVFAITITTTLGEINDYHMNWSYHSPVSSTVEWIDNLTYTYSCCTAIVLLGQLFLFSASVNIAL